MKKMTKAETKKLANECGYNSMYCGKAKQFTFTKMTGIQNVQLDPEKVKAFEKEYKKSIELTWD